MPTEMLYYLGNKAIIQNANGEVLLLKIKKDGRTYWDLPGGRINRGETVESALTREVQEETGITNLVIEKHLGMALSDVQIPITPDQKGGLILSIYKCSAPNITNLLPEDNMEIFWQSPDEALQSIGQFPTELLKTIAFALK